MLHIEIDGKKLAVEEGAMVIEAAETAGIYIPRFCYHKKLSVAANCRMCLVEVEKVSKPVPACATPVTEGMRIFTRSEKTLGAQKGVMEFLLINHPLDCPICDQGGECELQDLAVGYGRDVSRYHEAKRIIKDQDIGPLISTEMTRCIQCTRCVRFGQEIGGIMELGATGRGEHMLIGTYVESTVDSELSGNMIDLCPVGALTSKPFRYSARPWELAELPSISPHDCVGANLIVEVRRDKVMRVLPRENEEINEVWISDRDRFSYTALNGPDRLRAPLVRMADGWREVEWEVALDRAQEGLKGAITRYGAETLGALASSQLTVEEGFLLQRLVRGLGSDNIDHRLHQNDFRDDVTAPVFPWLGHTIEELERRDAVLLVGSNVRKDQPLLGHRLRKAFLDGAQITAINPLDFAFTFDLAARIVVPPAQIPERLAAVALAVAERMRLPVPAGLARFAAGLIVEPAEAHIAEILCSAHSPSILLGPLALGHSQAADLRALAQFIAAASHAKLGFLPQGNSAGAWLAGLIPHRGPFGAPRSVSGRTATGMMDGTLKAFLIMDAEPVLEGVNGTRSLAALKAAECVVALSAFRTEALDYAHVILPMAPFTETDGTFVNGEGRWQSFGAVVTPLNETRPGWKIIRVLADRLGVHGCDFDSVQDIRNHFEQKMAPSAQYGDWLFPDARPSSMILERVATVSLYDSDSVVRRAPPLRLSKDCGRPIAMLHPDEAARHNVTPGTHARITMGSVSTVLEVGLDTTVPLGVISIPTVLSETSMLPTTGPVLLSSL